MSDLISTHRIIYDPAEKEERGIRTVLGAGKL